MSAPDDELREAIGMALSDADTACVEVLAEGER